MRNIVNRPFERMCTALLLLFALSIEATALRFPDVVAALDAADSEQHFQKKAALFKEVEVYPIKSCKEATRIYNWLQEYPDRTVRKGGTNQASIFAQSVAKALSHTISAECHTDIAKWLSSEVRFLPPEILGVALRSAAQISEQTIMKESLRYERIHALIHAAGDGKNEKALPVLRKILKKGLYDYSADYGVGRIGKKEDLEWFIVELEKGDRSLRMRLSEFGPLAIQRIMQEVDNPAVPKDVSGRIRHWISGVRGRENIPVLIPLLKHSDPFIVKMAAKALSDNASTEDEPLLLSMLEHQNSDVRRSAVDALARNDIWRFRYITPILHILQSDRAARFAAEQAAERLALCEAIPILQEVARTAGRDDYGMAAKLIEDMSRGWTAFPTKPTGRKFDEYNQSLMDQWAQPESPDKDRYWAAQNWAHDGLSEKAIPLYREVLLNGTDDASRYKCLRDLWRLKTDETKEIMNQAAKLPDIGTSAQYALNHWDEGCRGAVPSNGREN